MVSGYFISLFSKKVEVAVKVNTQTTNTSPFALHILYIFLQNHNVKDWSNDLLNIREQLSVSKDEIAYDTTDIPTFWHSKKTIIQNKQQSLCWKPCFSPN